MNASDKIYIAGHRGLVGSALMRRLSSSSVAGGSETLVSACPLAGEGPGERARRDWAQILNSCNAAKPHIP